MGMLMRVILIKLTLYLTEECLQRKVSPFNFLANTVKVKKKTDNFNPYRLQAQSALVLQ